MKIIKNFFDINNEAWIKNQILSGFKNVSLVATLGWHDIRGRYRRSAIGPFWLTISMGLMIASIGVVFGKIFKTHMDEYLPFLAAGIILWVFITGTINEGCTAFIDAESIIKQLPIPLFVHILRVLWRNILILAHNILILPLVLVVMGNRIGLEVVLAIPGLLLVTLCLSWVALLFAMLCARYRDLAQIIVSVLQVTFYLTPIIWMPSLLPDRMSATFLQFNPFYHLLELIRGPLLGIVPSLTSWLVVTVMAVVGWVFTLLIFSLLRNRVAYWL
jgi:ABC-type polysaccharide/polyol phosphate export permease